VENRAIDVATIVQRKGINKNGYKECGFKVQGTKKGKSWAQVDTSEHSSIPDKVGRHAF
jgi:hypothetical protein